MCFPDVVNHSGHAVTIRSDEVDDVLRTHQ